MAELAIRPGLYLVHKPVGPSSASLVRDFAEEIRAAGIRPDKLPLCHGGALDPFACGLLLLLAGPATRLMDFLHPIPKAYEACVAWGAETDTGDAGGAIVASADASALTPERLDAALAAQLGWRDQVPPAHSNKRIGGERAYRKAFRGEPVDLPPSRVYLHEARWLSHDLTGPAPRSRLSLVCRGGYYVRSLARDLGRSLGCPAHLTSLRRTSIGPWPDPAPGTRTLIAGDSLLPWCPSRQVSAREADTLAARRPIPEGPVDPPSWSLPPDFPAPDAPIRALYAGSLVALLRADAASLHPAILLGAGL